MRNYHFIIVALIILISGCKNSIFYPNHYIRQNKKSTFIESSYGYRDSVVLNINLCHYHNLDWTPNTAGKLVLNPRQIKNDLTLAYSTYFSVSKKHSDPEAYFGVDCDLKADDILTKHKSNKAVFKSSHKLSASFIIKSASMKRLEGGGGLEVAEDMGDDKHRLEYKLISSLYQNDTLIYMDNRSHWTEVFSERGEQLMYQVPQVVIDSLVTLTLQEYFERME